MTLTSEINQSSAETIVSGACVPEDQLYMMKLSYTFNQEAYTIIKIRWRYAKVFGHGKQEMCNFLNIREVEVGMIVNQLGIIEKDYKGTRLIDNSDPFSKKIHTIPDNSKKAQNIIKILPSKFREITETVVNHIKSTHQCNIDALLSSKDTKSAALNRDKWYSMALKWMDSNKCYQAFEFINGAAGTEVAKCGWVGFGVDAAKRCIKNISDNELNDATLFEWSRWETK